MTGIDVPLWFRAMPSLLVATVVFLSGLIAQSPPKVILTTTTFVLVVGIVIQVTVARLAA